MTCTFRPLVYAKHLKVIQVGESFIMDDLGSPESCRVSAYKYGRKHGKKFSVRQTEEGIKCYRIA